MWVYRNLCDCFALPRDETYFERRNPMTSLSPLAFTVLDQVEPTRWKCEDEVVASVKDYAGMRSVSVRDVVGALLFLVADGKVERRFIQTDVEEDPEPPDTEEQVHYQFDMLTPNPRGL